MRPISPEARRTIYSDGEQRAIREQLERVLANRLFSHSKRYPILLRYIVERALAGAPSDLKERALGCAVFGRDPNYDTNADPIVRVTAAEVRKRIAQYYQEYGHEREPRIELAPGSYIPEFDLTLTTVSSTGTPPETSQVSRPNLMLPAVAPGCNMPEFDLTRTSISGTATAPRAPQVSRPILVRAAVLFSALVLGSLAFFQPGLPQTGLDQFWAPILDSSGTVLLCAGEGQLLPSSPHNKHQHGGDVPSPRTGKSCPTGP